MISRVDGHHFGETHGVTRTYDARSTNALIAATLGDHILQFGATHHTLIIDNVILRPTPLEYRIFALLQAAHPYPVPMETLIHDLFDQEKYYAEETRLKRHISSLRAKITMFGFYVTRVQDIGYVLTVLPPKCSETH